MIALYSLVIENGGIKIGKHLLILKKYVAYISIVEVLKI